MQGCASFVMMKGILKKIVKLSCEVTMKNVLESIDTLYLILANEWNGQKTMASFSYMNYS